VESAKAARAKSRKTAVIGTRNKVLTVIKEPGISKNELAIGTSLLDQGRKSKGYLDIETRVLDTAMLKLLLLQS
jgi:hypothetical protein